MATGQYPRWTSGTFLSTIKRCKLSWFGHVCLHDTLLKIIVQGTLDCSRRRGKPHKSWKDGQHKGMDRPIDVVIAAHRG